MDKAELILPSFAKINLTLKVVGKRSDGFHELVTAFQTVSLADELHFQRSHKLELSCDTPAIPTNENNLIIRAATKLKEKYQVSAGAEIFLKKNIPSPGGLGGGSSNAAIALLGLINLWGIKANFDEILSMASELGSDVPFFLYGGTAIGTGRGTEIELVPEVSINDLIIVDPGISVPTAEIFKRLNVPDLTKDVSDNILTNCRFDVENVGKTNVKLENDLENAAFSLYPGILEAKQFLMNAGAQKSLMSGSGASVFGIFDNEESRQTALKALGEKTNWRSFAVTAISRYQYRDALREVLI